ncbi:unnamed protein product [Caenorhabditis brenneri]
MELWLLKLIMAVTLFATNFGSALLTIFMVKKATSRYAAIACTIAQSLTGGLFLGLVFLLLDPEVKLAKEDLEVKHNLRLPSHITAITLAAGVFIMLILENVEKFFAKKDPAAMNLEVEMVPLRPEFHINSESTPPPTTEPSFLKYLFFAVFMSLHSIFEGFPIGYKKSSAALNAYFFPLLLHKILEAVALAFAGIKQKPLFAIIGSLTHSLMTPLGALVGTLLASEDLSIGWDVALLILIGVSTGTLMYITFETLAELKNNEEYQAFNDFLKLGLIALGFALTAGIAIIVEKLEEEDVTSAVAV